MCQPTDSGRTTSFQNVEHAIRNQSSNDENPKG